MKLLWKISLLLLLTHLINSDQFLTVFLQKCTASCHKDFCNVKVSCRPYNRTGKLASMDVYMHPGIILEAPIYLQVTAYKKFATVYRQHMINVTIELCQQITRRDHPIAKNIFEAYTDKDENFMDPCPFFGHRFLKPRFSDYHYLPLIPVGEWIFQFSISQNITGTVTRILTFSNYYEIKPTSAIQF